MASHVKAPRDKLAAIALMCLVGVLWNVVEGIGILLSRDYSLFQIVATRYGVHLTLMLLFVLPWKGAGMLRTANWKKQGLQGAMMALMPLCFILAIGYMPARQVNGVLWAAPVVVLVAAHLLLGERASLATYLVCVLGCVGIALALGLRTLPLNLGLVLALGSSITFALYLVISRGLRAEPIMTSLFYTALCVFAPFAIFAAPQWSTPSLRDFAIMATIGVAGFFLLWAIHRATELAPASTLAPWLLVAPLISYVLLDIATHSFNGKLALGGAIVTAAGLAAMLYIGIRGDASHSSGHATR